MIDKSNIFKKRKVLSTGGAGFIGFHLAKKLEKQGYIIDIIDNLSRGRFDYEFKDFVKKKNISFIKYDLTKKKFPLVSKNYYLIFHFAAIVGVTNVVNQPFEVLTKNILALKNLIDFAKTQRQLDRFIFTSTSEVYAGSLRNGLLSFPTKESSLLTINEEMNTRDSYMLSKIYGENMCRFSGLPYLIIRPHNIFGERMGMSHAIPELIKKIQSDKKVLNVYNPNHKRTFCYVGDAINMMMKLIDTKKSLNKIYNLGNTKNEIKILDLAKKIMKILNKKKIIKKIALNNFSPKRRLPSTKKMTKDTGYRIDSLLDNNLEKTINWYIANIS